MGSNPPSPTRETGALLIQPPRPVAGRQTVIHASSLAGRQESGQANRQAFIQVGKQTYIYAQCNHENRHTDRKSGRHIIRQVVI